MASKHILTLDDDPDFNNLLKLSLKKVGVTAVTTTTPEEFSEKLRTDPPAVCLIDLNLDVAYGAGYQMVQAIRKKIGYELPIIVISRRSSADDISRALELGANDFVSKPIDDTFLAQKIKQYIELSEEVKDLPFFKVSEKDWHCDFEYELSIKKVNEFGLTLSGNYFLSKGTPLNLKGNHLIGILGGPGPWRFTVNNCWVDEESKEYHTFLEFDFEDPDIMSEVRKFLLAHAP